MLQPFAAVLVFAAFLLSGAPAVRAQELPPADPRIVLNLITENDSYGLDGTDRWYTNGLRLGWQSGE
ncbi:lipid A-modifier LpxR family protein, partial [Acinetobacter baumannii]